jgi:hypothetical protein
MKPAGVTAFHNDAVAPHAYSSFKLQEQADELQKIADGLIV